MKVDRRLLDHCGAIRMTPEEDEDIWHAYNLIREGDLVKATTYRKVKMESATGTAKSNTIRTSLNIMVEKIEYDSQACLLRVNGRNAEENQHVKMSQYHTLELHLKTTFTLTKTYWDTVDLERIETISNPAQRADVVAVVMQEGLAYVCLLLSSMTLVRAKIEQSIPRKRHGFVSNHDKGIQKFFENVMQALLRNLNFNVIKCVLIASPGFVREEFFNYIIQYATQTDNKALLENKDKFLLVHSSSGFKHSLREVLSDPAVTAKLADTKAAGEVKALENFYAMLQNEPDKAFYGLKHVEKANEAQAIEVLMIADGLFRKCDVATRQRYVRLYEGTKAAGGEVKIFSSLHVSGEQLEQLTGIAAILRFPMPELDEEEQESEEDEEEKEKVEKPEVVNSEESDQENE